MCFFEGCVHCGMMGLIIRVGHCVGFWLHTVEVSCLSHQNLNRVGIRSVILFAVGSLSFVTTICFPLSVG